MANSSVLVLPRTTTPASWSLRTAVAVYGATKPSRILEPHVQGSPSTVNTSLIATGMPNNGEYIPLIPGCIALIGALKRPCRIDVQKGMQRRLKLRDPVQRRLHQLAAGERPALQAGSHFGQG